MTDTGQRRAVILTTRESISEVRELMASLNIETAAVVLQRRRSPDTITFLGRGKLEEAREVVERTGADLVVVNGVLKPNQFFSLTEVLNVEVYDKIRLILEIFEERVGSREAAIQVELMQLSFEIPILKEYVHRGKLKEHPGFLAGGEYQVDYYLRRARRRTAKLRRELKEVEERRRLQREMRKRRGIFVVSLAGYTNAGKTSLFNVLTDENAPVEQRLFTTLLSKIRAMKRMPHVVLADTVGFIEDLPPYLIEAFKPTLDEIYTADLILLVVDISEGEEEAMRKFLTSLEIIRERGLGRKVLLVGNKIDAAEENYNRVLERLRASSRGMVSEVFAVSALEGQGLEDLKEGIRRNLPRDVEYLIHLPCCGEMDGVMRWLEAKTTVLKVEESDLTVKVLAPRRVIKEVEERVKEMGGRVEVLKVTGEG
ncbi:MAG: GTPase HflX [Thermoplasmata archaeon]|nr:GTPase HflX [Thermoplasmata archaeon]